jgi:tetratricopeptide (TPR) repeat protein
MADARRLDSEPAPAAGIDRDSQVESLLVDGLDRYFAGRYEDAIHIWTRVLFLDRSHARAHAYIDRARTTLAERQRRSEELLHVSQDLLARGDAGAARDLLTEAVATTGDDERASALRVKLERHERAQPLSAPGWSRRFTEPVPGWSWGPNSPTAMVVAAALAATVLLAVALPSVELRNWMGFGAPPDALAAASAPVEPTVLSSSEVALVRARTLYARGRLAQALQALDRVSEDSAVREEADDLRVEIQRLLLAGGHEHRLGSQPDPGIGR